MRLPDNYILEKRDIKHARIRVSENLLVRVLVPSEFSEYEIGLLLQKKKKWIETHLQKFRTKKTEIILHYNQVLLLGNRYTYFYQANLNTRVVVNIDHKTVQAKINLLDPTVLDRWYRKYARKYILQRLSELSTINKIRYNRVFIRAQQKKWGNCSPQKNLSFNWRLIKAPPFVIDYIILHELLHTRIMNHTQKFWSELRVLCPDYSRAIEWLEKYKI